MIYLFILAGFALLSCIVWWRTRDAKIVRINEGEIYNFKSIFEITGLPMVTLEQNGKKYHFLVDTGCNTSIISDNCGIQATPVKCEEHTICGMNGDGDGSKAIDTKALIRLERDGIQYEHIFDIADLDAAREKMVKTWNDDIIRALGEGTIFSGMLGGDFFDKYNWVIDYCEKVVYSRKD